MSTPRRAIRSREEFRLLKTSGVIGFDYEAECGGENLFGFSCDEAGGPVTVTFNRRLEGYEIDLAVLRALLDEAEQKLQTDRREFQAVFPDLA